MSKHVAQFAWQAIQELVVYKYPAAQEQEGAVPTKYLLVSQAVHVLILEKQVLHFQLHWVHWLSIVLKPHYEKQVADALSQILQLLVAP